MSKIIKASGSQIKNIYMLQASRNTERVFENGGGSLQGILMDLQKLMSPGNFTLLKKMSWRCRSQTAL